MQGLPKYPNWSSILNSTAPIVAALLATISTATFLAILQSNFISKDILIGPPEWSSSNAVLVLGVLSTAIFVALTFVLAYAQASNFDLLSTEGQDALFARGNVGDEEQKNVFRNEYRHRTEVWMRWVTLLAWAGFTALILAMMGLAFGHVQWFSSVLALIAALVSVTLFMPGRGKLFSVLHRVVGLLFLAISIVLFLGTLPWLEFTTIP